MSATKQAEYPDLPKQGPSTRGQQLRIQAPAHSKLRGPQKRFNHLSAKLETLRKRLAELQQIQEQAQKRVLELVVPQRERHKAADRAMILCVHELLCKTRPVAFPKQAHRELVVEKLLATCLEYLETHSREDAEIVAIHDAHAPCSYAQLEEEELEELHEDYRDIFEEEVPEGISREQLEEMLAQAYGDEFFGMGAEEFEPRPKRKPSAKAEKRAAEKAAAAAEAEREISQSVREVYRKLASALHPDRAPAGDERERRHELMQRVNNCYKRADLLGLLSLQLEIEQIDASHLATVSEQRLKGYNQLLSEQVRELETEISLIESDIRARLSCPVHRITVDTVLADIELAARQYSQEISETEKLCCSLQIYSYRTRWIKQLQRERREQLALEQELDEMFSDMFENLLDPDEYDGDLDEDFEPWIISPQDAPEPGGGSSRKKKNKKKKK